MDHIYTIGISGASCSGKTWLADKIKSIYPDKIVVFPMDSYYKGNEFVETLEFRYDNPLSVDYSKFYNDLYALRTGEIVGLPIYDYESHKIVGVEQIQAKFIIVVEGLFSFYEESIRGLFDLKIWTEASDEVLLNRRIERDVRERGDTYYSIIKRYEKEVLPAYEKYIKNLMSFADFVVK